MSLHRCIILIVLTLLLFIPVIEAPEANPYDLYNIDTYNCLDLAIDCQRWHEGNGINTTIVIGMFNETHGHAWLIDTDTGKDITGYVPEWAYKQIIYGLDKEQE